MVDFAIDVVVNPNTANRGISQVESNLNNLNNTAARTGDLIKRAFAFVGISFGISQLSTLANTFATLQNQVRVASGGVGDVNKTLDRLFEVANRSRVPIEGTVQLFQRLSFAAGELGANQDDLFQFVETVSKALAIQGGAASSASGALLQLSQAVGSGIVRAEEFNSILEGAFPIALAAARGIDEAGGSVSRLRKLITEGKITSEEFFRGLLSQSSAIDATFNTTSATVGQAFIKLGNSVLDFVGKLDSSLGLSRSFAGLISNLADSIKDLAGAVTVAGITLLFYFGPAAISGIAAAIGTRLIPILAALRVSFLTIGTSFLIGGFSALIPLVLSLAAVLSGGLFVALIAATTAVFTAQDTFVSFFNSLGIDGERALLSFAALIEGTVSVAVGLFQGLKESVLGIINFLQVQIFKIDDSIRRLRGAAPANPEDYGLTPESAIRSGKSLAENFQKGFEQGSQGFGLVDSILQPKAVSIAAPDAANPAKKFNEVTEEMKKTIERQKKLLEDIKGPALSYQQNIDDLNTLLKAGKINQEEYTRAMEGFQLQILDTDRTLNGGLKRGLLGIKEEFGDLSRVAEDTLVNAFSSAEDALVEFVKTGKLSFTDLVDSIVEDLARLVIRQQITAPLANAIGGLGRSSSKSGGLTGFLGNAIGSLFGFANGGSFVVPGGGTTDSQLVAFKATPNERVTVTRPDQAMGSGTTVVNVINNTSSQVQVQEARDGSGQRLEIFIDDAVARNISAPNSKTSRALKQYSSRSLISR